MLLSVKLTGLLVGCGDPLPKKKTRMGPFAPAAAEWMWAAITLEMSSTSIVYVTVVPSETYWTRPLAPVLRAGTSLAGDSVASKTSIPSVPFVQPLETKPTNAHKAPAE